MNDLRIRIYIEQVFINFSRRSIKVIVDSDGYDDTIEVAMD